MIGEYILQDQRVAKISFTGSTAVGKVHKYIHPMHPILFSVHQCIAHLL